MSVRFKSDTRLTVPDVLELVADFLREGLPTPIAIATYGGRPRVQVQIDDIAAWCEVLDVVLPEWRPSEQLPETLFATWPDGTWGGHVIELAACCPAPTEVCS